MSVLYTSVCLCASNSFKSTVYNVKYAIKIQKISAVNYSLRLRALLNTSKPAICNCDRYHYNIANQTRKCSANVPIKQFRFKSSSIQSVHPQMVRSHEMILSMTVIFSATERVVQLGCWRLGWHRRKICRVQAGSSATFMQINVN